MPPRNPREMRLRLAALGELDARDLSIGEQREFRSGMTSNTDPSPEGHAMSDPVFTRAEWEAYDATKGKKAQLDVGDPKPNGTGPRSLEEADAIRNRYHAPANGAAEIQGRPNERLTRDQSFREYIRRAAENGVNYAPQEGMAPRPVQFESDDYVNDWWGMRFGFIPETRSLNTATTALAATPQSWQGSLVDYLYANSLLANLPFSHVPMATQQVNVSVLAAPAAPAWLAKGSTIGIDASPALVGVPMAAYGGFKEISLITIEAAQSAYAVGGLGDLVAHSVARNMSLALDAAIFMGVAGSGGTTYPGLAAETGFTTRKMTGVSGSGVTPTDTTEPSIIHQLIRANNGKVTGFAANQNVIGTYSRLNGGGTYPMYYPMPRDVENIPWAITSNPNIVPTTEVYDGSALTGSNCSSIWAGDWKYLLVGTPPEPGDVRFARALCGHRQRRRLCGLPWRGAPGSADRVQPDYWPEGLIPDEQHSRHQQASDVLPEHACARDPATGVHGCQRS